MRRTARLAAMLALILAFAGPALAAQRPVTVRLLAINDLHGHLEPVAGADGEVNGRPAGGVEYLATHLKRAAAERPNSVIVAAGDLIGASPLISAHFDDHPTIEALNAIGLKVTSIGNHELDHGPDEFLRRTADARFRYLAGNVLRTDQGGQPLRPTVTVLTVGGVKIGFIGETLQGTGHMLSAPAAAHLTFEDEATVANAAAAQLRRQGVRAIVLLIHQGGRQARPEGGGEIDPDGCANFGGDIVPIVQRLSPAITLVLSAHTHAAYNCRIAGHVVTSAASFGRLFTVADLTIDPRSDRILKIVAHNRVVTRDVPKDPDQTAILARYRPQAEAIAGRVVGRASAPLERTADHAGQSVMGEVIADAELEATRAVPGGAQMAVMNAGGVRGNLASLAPPDGGPRPVLYGDVFAAQPFSNRLTVRTLTGAEVREMLEEQFVSPTKADMLQVSAGFSYRYRRDAPAGQHVDAASIRLDGRPITPDEPVRVAMADFLASGEAGFPVFKQGRDAVTLDVDDVGALSRYFEGRTVVSPPARDRVTRTD